jgi:hypothetical protein
VRVSGEAGCSVPRLPSRPAERGVHACGDPIENLNGSVADYTKNVKRWRGGGMILRWVGAVVEQGARTEEEAA